MFLAVNSLLFEIIFSSSGRVVSRTSVIHGWFVYWVFGLEMRRLSKSEIRFRMALFSFFTLLDAQGLKSLKGYWPYLIAFRSCISNGKPE